jgi:hypothetical protein
MSTITKIAISIVVLICVFIAGRFSKRPVEKIKIVKQTKTEFKYIKQASTKEELKACYDSKLGITVKERDGNWIDIEARDKCKLAKKSIMVSPVIKNNYAYINYDMNNIQIMYYRKFGSFLIGAGVSSSKNVYVGIGYNF